MVKTDKIMFILTVAVVTIVIYIATITPDHMNVLEYIFSLIGISSDAGGIILFLTMTWLILKIIFSVYEYK